MKSDWLQETASQPAREGQHDEHQQINELRDGRSSRSPPGKATMSWEKRTKQTIEVGDKVCYSRQFLQSTGQFTGDTPHARGIVTAIVPLGEQTKLAEIEWDTPDLPKRVNTANLSKVTEKGISERY